MNLDKARAALAAAKRAPNHAKVHQLEAAVEALIDAVAGQAADTKPKGKK